MLFNNTTTKVENTGAAIVYSQMSILAWIKFAGNGEDGFGRILVADEFTTAGFRFRLRPTNTTIDLFRTFSTTNGTWRAATGAVANTGRWYCVAVSHDGGSTANVPAWWIRDSTTGPNLVTSANTTVTAPAGTVTLTGVGYCAGNVTGQTATFDGSICYLQLWDRILTYGEFNTAMHNPGRITNGLKLFLPLRDSADGADLSGSGFNGTVTAGGNSDGPPCGPLYTFGSRGYQDQYYSAPAGGGHGLLIAQKRNHLVRN